MTPFTTRPELQGTFGMVASTHWLATAAGWRCSSGAATRSTPRSRPGFTLQVVEPHLNGPGGDLPAVFWSAERGEPLVLCAPGRRARGGDDRALRAEGLDLVPGTGLLAACVPGAFGGWLTLLAELGTWRLARRARLRDRLRRARLPGRARDPVHDPRVPRSCCGAGPAPPSSTCRRPSPGSRFRNPALAATYRRIVEESRGGSREERDRARARRSSTRASSRRRSTASRAANGGLPDRRRPGVVAGDPRGAGHARLPGADGLQDAARGARARSSCSSSRCSTASTSAELSRRRVRPHRRRVREARVRRPRGVLRRPHSPTCRSSGCCRAEYNDERRRLVGDDASGELRPGRAAGCRRSSYGGGGRRRRRADPREPARGDTVPPRRRRPLRQPRLGDAERRLAPELAGDPGARLAARHARADVLARGGPAVVARAAQAAADDAHAVAGAARRQPVPRLRHAGRRPAGPVDAALLPAPRRLRRRPAGGDRRAELPHRPLPVVVLPAAGARRARSRRGPVGRGRSRRAAPPRPRRRGRRATGRSGGVSAVVPRAPTGSCGRGRTRAGCRATPPAAERRSRQPTVRTSLPCVRPVSIASCARAASARGNVAET